MDEEEESTTTDETVDTKPGPEENITPTPVTPFTPVTPKKVNKNLECPECPEKVCADEVLDRSAFGRPDASNTEFVYYSNTLREIAPKLTNETDRHLVIPWIRKLFSPEYYNHRFRAKRNKFLLHLVLLIINDEAWGIFKEKPPEGALMEPEELAQTNLPWFAEWERDSMWQEILTELPEGTSRMHCSIHSNEAVCEDDKEHGRQLDEEFAFLLYLTRPYCILLRSASDRMHAALWLQTLCTIRPDACSTMKSLRNEYCIAMLGYVHELRIGGPFSGTPFNPLPPLSDMMKILADRNPVIDPCSAEAEEFLKDQPVPEEGAFCYLAITGELMDTTMNELD